jgi:hypothetical protein
MVSFPAQPDAVPPIRRWADRLRHAARVMATELDSLRTDDARDRFIATFRDEFSHRRPIDEPLLRCVLARPVRAPSADMPIDERLWWCLASRDSFPPRALRAAAGALTSGFGREPVESWTERELRVMHAAINRAIIARDAALFDRVLGAADWLIDNVQADNATNRPWGVHAVIIRGVLGHTHAEHDASGMIHAAKAATGEADRLSQIILLDAARALDRWIA